MVAQMPSVKWNPVLRQYFPVDGMFQRQQRLSLLLRLLRPPPPRAPSSQDPDTVVVYPPTSAVTDPLELSPQTGGGGGGVRDKWWTEDSDTVNWPRDHGSQGLTHHTNRSNLFIQG